MSCGEPWCPPGYYDNERADPNCSWCHGSGVVRSSIDICQPECPCIEESDEWLPGALAAAVFGPLFDLLEACP